MSDQIISGEFKAEINEETGKLGIRPTWMPNAEPHWADTVAHDLLEHFPEDDGGIEAEFMALGAGYWLRHESGWASAKYPQDNRSAANITSGDFVNVYWYVTHEGFTLMDPGTVEPIEDENTDYNLQQIARKGLERVQQDQEIHNLDPDEAEAEKLFMFCCDQTREKILGWLRKGYRRATERFDRCDAYSLAESVFREIESRVSTWLENTAEEGMFLDVEIDLDSYSVTLEVGYGALTEREECHECGGNRELDGEEQGNYHDCPAGCIEKGNDSCPECKGVGYVCPSVKCDVCDEDGLVSAYYREEI